MFCLHIILHGFDRRRRIQIQTELMVRKLTSYSEKSIFQNEYSKRHWFSQNVFAEVLRNMCITKIFLIFMN